MVERFHTIEADLYAPNLGRWHITRVATDAHARPLWQVAKEAHG